MAVKAEADALVTPLERRLQIGEWRFEEERHSVCRGDEERHLEPKAAAVLARLAQQPGRVVARRELLAAGWPGLYVGEEVLANTIYQLRRALGDDARAPRYIETIPRRGYRLLAATAALPAPTSRRQPTRFRLRAGSSFTATTPPPAGHRQQAPRTWPWAATLLVLLAAAVGLGLGLRAATPVGPAETDRREAERLAARGWQALDSLDSGAAGRAATWAEMALARDPASAAARALEASALAERTAGGEIPATEGYPRTRAAAEQALALAPGHPEALRARAVARWLGSWDWAGAEQDLRAAVASAPDAVRARTTLAELLFFAGRAEEADQELETALQLAPASPRVRLTAATIATFGGRSEEARHHLLAALVASPDHPTLRHQLAKLAEPPAAAAPAATLDAASAERLLAKQRLRPGHLAVLYAGSGDGDRALGWLERAVSEHDTTVLYFRFDPRWDALREHPRYRRAMRAVEAAS